MSDRPDEISATTPNDALPRRARPLGSKRAVWATLAGYLCLLALLAYVLRDGRPPASTPTWEVSRFSWLTALAARLLFRAAIEGLASLVLGLLWTLAIGHRPWRLPHAVVAVAPLSTVALLATIWLGAVPALPDLLIPGIGSLLGVAVGSALLAGTTARRLLVELALIVAVGLASLTAAAWAATSAQPDQFPATEVTSSEKHRLMVLIKNSRAVRQQDAQALELTDHDVNLLAAWWLRADRSDRKVRVRFTEAGGVHAEATLAVGRPFGFTRYLNLQATARLVVKAGQMRLDLNACSVGSLWAPRITLGWLSHMMQSIVTQDPHLNTLLACIESLDIGPGTLHVVGNADQFRQRILPTLVAKASITPEVTAAIRAHVRHLVLAAHTMPRRGDDRFVWIVRTAFAFARERSYWNRPVDENHAALLAVAILAGDTRIEALVGPVIDGDIRREAKRRMRNFRLYGRVDWEKHLVISAALTLLLDEAMDEAIGLMKERLDSAGGGSGFSFSDLMADRAGSRLARRAVRDEASARRLQDELASRFVVSDLFPPARDLPEGIDEAELKHRYGGVGGAGYRRLEAEIVRKLDRCKLLGRETASPLDR